jgi:hypothetical protein
LSAASTISNVFWAAGNCDFDPFALLRLAVYFYMTHVVVEAVYIFAHKQLYGTIPATGTTPRAKADVSCEPKSATSPNSEASPFKGGARVDDLSDERGGGILSEPFPLPSCRKIDPTEGWTFDIQESFSLDYLTFYVIAAGFLLLLMVLFVNAALPLCFSSTDAAGRSLVGVKIYFTNIFLGSPLVLFYCAFLSR